MCAIVGDNELILLVLVLIVLVVVLLLLLFLLVLPCLFFLNTSIFQWICYKSSWPTLCLCYYAGRV